MRTSLSLLVALAAATGSMRGQSVGLNWFGVYPNSTDATSRGALPPFSSGDLLVEVRGRSFESPANVHGPTGADFAGIGDVATVPGGRGRVRALVADIEDQDWTTREAFDLCIVAEDPDVPGQPGVPPAGNKLGPEVLLRTTSLIPPLGGCDPHCQVTVTLATPADVLPGLDTWYFGVGLSANPNWTADGLSVHMASFDGLGPGFGNAGDNPRDGVVSLGQTRDVTAGALVPRTTMAARTYNVHVLTEAPILEFGATIDAPARVGPDPNYGVAGHYPDQCGAGNTGRMAAYPGYPGRAGVGDGFAIRVRDSNAANAVGAVLLVASSPSSPSGFSGNQVYLGFTAGGFVLPAAGVVALGFVTDIQGRFEIATRPASAFCSATGRLAGQAAVVNTTTGLVHLSNGVSTSF